MDTMTPLEHLIFEIGNRPMEYLWLKIETRERMMNSKIFFGE